MSKLIDLTGQKFGRLTVLKRSEDYISKSREKTVQWECQCDCGNICIVSGRGLKSGKTQSCGCLRREKIIERNKKTAKDLTGQRFGKLIALYPTDKRINNNYIVWRCKCDCGNEIEVASTYLLRGNTRSCGCLIKDASKKLIKDLTGQRFGKLVALYPMDKRSGSSVIWYCKCDCGNYHEVASKTLTSGLVQSCGCLKNFVGEEKIAQILRDNNIYFERQKTFNNCKFQDSKQLAKFDFYIPKYNCLIEYDGIQHYQPRQFGGCTQEQAQYNFEKTKQHDIYKNQWCKENNILLIRIPYTHIKQITINDLIIDKEKI